MSARQRGKTVKCKGLAQGEKEVVSCATPFEIFFM